MRLPRPFSPVLPILLSLLPVAAADPAQGAGEPPPEVHIHRAAGPIEIDGDLSDPGWRGAAEVDTWYETSPGDNVAAPVGSRAWLTYDDRYFYAAFEFAEPDMKSLRAPFGDRDSIGGDIDFGGVLLDTRNEAKAAIEMFANPHNIQYDAIVNDASGEDPSFDLYWDSATRTGADAWYLEMRIPFSSLRYGKADPQTWGLLLFRNRPRQFRTQMYSVKLPRGSSCFICHEGKITGLAGLPHGGHYVLAPYGTLKYGGQPQGGIAGAPIDSHSQSDGGLDAKWIPNASTAFDATVNPDFSQVEADVAQITANQRFALFYPEKRPFFLEGLDLFATPIQAVYTRQLTAPRWGARATGEIGGTAYTLLAAEDRGGGSVIIPGPQESRFANQDFTSQVVIGRARRDLGSGFASFLLTDREIAGGGSNRVAGPDFQWRPSGADQITGQLLLSRTRTPDLPALDPEWDGRDLSSHALYLQWTHSTAHWDGSATYKDIGDDFRADLGFLPQVGVRDGRGVLGYSLYPESGPFRNVRSYAALRHIEDTNGDLLLSQVTPAIEAQGFWNSYVDLEARFATIRVGDRLFHYHYLYSIVQMSPSHAIGQISLTATFGQAIDFDNARPGHGAEITLSSVLRPTDHLELVLDGSRQWLDVSPEGVSRRLFTAEVERIKATYTFSARTFLRLVAQRDRLGLDPALYTFAVTPRSEDFTRSALFAYKINWQTVLFLGYGDDRRLSEGRGGLAEVDRQLFLKVSYAFQR
jgi:Domain of unknown function (DUF5916)